TLLVRRAERLAADAVAALVAAVGVPEAAHALIVAVDGAEAGRAVARRAPFGDAVVELPPLRERRADVPMLAERMAERWHGAPIALADDARAALAERAWPGNAAEVAGVVAAAVARIPADARELPLHAFQGRTA
ncbi:MAG: AAA-type ATPase lid domain-containing protein, partial [Gemmatirosa sp.]